MLMRQQINHVDFCHDSAVLKRVWYYSRCSKNFSLFTIHFSLKTILSPLSSFNCA